MPPAASPPAVLPPPTAVRSAPAGTVYARPVAAPGVVSFRASFPCPPGAPADDLARRLVVRVLDRGTRHRDRHAFADALERRGASLAFHTDDLRVGFHGRALAADVRDVLALAAEALNEPALDADEIEKARRRLDAAFRSAEEETGAQADAALRRALFPPGHPLHERPFADERAVLDTAPPEAVRARHAAFAAGPLDLVLAGDVDGLALDALLGRFGPRAPVAAVDYGGGARPAPGRTDVPVPGKASVDVRLGHAVALRRTSPDYLALRLALFALGGNFSARLMQTVRDAEGLTYGISAGLAGLGGPHDGLAEVRVTLSPAHLDRGVASTRREVARLAAEGVADDEVRRAAETVAGGHVVGLSTSGGVAAALLNAVEDGLGPGWLDALPDRVRAVTPAAVNAAVAAHLRPDALHEVRAGTV